MVVFHHPKRLHAESNVASLIRPARMYEAFSRIGEEVLEITGNGPEREKKWEDLKPRILSEVGEGVFYSESVNVPPALTWLRKKPHRMNFDYRLIQSIRNAGMPTGLFYRDIHWGFERPRGGGLRPFIKNKCIPVFGRRELKHYERSVDVLFLPDVRMADYLPLTFANSEIRSLPPGGEQQENPARKFSPEGGINLLYVGNIAPPIYDLRGYFAASAEEEKVRLKVITRERALKLHGALYEFNDVDGPQVLHAQGQELQQHYQEADIALCVWEGVEYHRFVMPVKVYESIAHGVPLIVSSSAEVLARFVEREKIGWVVQNADEFTMLLRRLAEHPGEIVERRQAVESIRHLHTWDQRAREVVEALRGAGPAAHTENEITKR